MRSKAVRRQKKRARRSEDFKYLPVSNPLTRFLRNTEAEGDSRVARLVAAATKEPFDVAEYRKQLVKKMERIRYPQPEEKGTETRTFYIYLLRKNAIDTVLEDSTLQEIWNCLLIPRIVSEDQEFAEQSLAVDGMPGSFHRRAGLDFFWQLGELEEAGKDVDPELEKRFGYHARLYLVTRYPASTYVDLFGGSRKPRRKPRQKKSRKRSGPDPWNARLAVEVALYWVLRTRLPAKVSDRFVRQLSLLISTESDVIGPDGNLAEAIETDRLGWSKELKKS